MQILEYKGFKGSYEYNDEYGIYFGTVDNAPGFVNFFAEHEDELGRYFREAVDEYLAKVGMTEQKLIDNLPKTEPVKNKKKASPAYIILILALCALIAYCGYRVVDKLLEYKASRDAYNTIKEASVEEVEEVIIGMDGEPITEEEKEKITGPVLDIDWNELGDSCVGWFLMDDISYPIMYSGDNDYYLHRLPDGTENYGGSLFLAGENNKQFEDDNSIIYGHNMSDGSMFGKLKKYAKEEYGSRSFYIFMPDGTRRQYAFFTILAVPSGHDAYAYQFPTKRSFVAYQMNMQELSLYASGIEPSKTNKIVTLSTCNGPAGTSQRLLIQGVEMETKTIS